MVESEDHTRHVINNQTEVGRMSCHNSMRRLTHMARTPTNTRQREMKTGLLQIIYTNPFVSLDHEDPYTHLTKFYELVSTLGASETEEEAVFVRLLIHRCKDRDYRICSKFYKSFVKHVNSSAGCY